MWTTRQGASTATTAPHSKPVALPMHTTDPPGSNALQKHTTARPGTLWFRNMTITTPASNQARPRTNKRGGQVGQEDHRAQFERDTANSLLSTAVILERIQG